MTESETSRQKASVLPRSASNRSALFICPAFPLWVGWWIVKATPARFAYSHLINPPLSPPAWVFPGVWSALCLLMGTSCYLIWRSPKSPARTRALVLYTIQLTLHYVWIGLFRSGTFGWAALEILVLVVCIGLTIHAFERVDLQAAWLLLPCFLWAAFSTYWIVAVYLLN